MRPRLQADADLNQKVWEASEAEEWENAVLFLPL